MSWRMYSLRFHCVWVSAFFWRMFRQFAGNLNLISTPFFRLYGLLRSFFLRILSVLAFSSTFSLLMVASARFNRSPPSFLALTLGGLSRFRRPVWVEVFPVCLVRVGLASVVFHLLSRRVHPCFVKNFFAYGNLCFLSVYLNHKIALIIIVVLFFCCGFIVDCVGVGVRLSPFVEIFYGCFFVFHEESPNHFLFGQSSKHVCG